MIILIGLALLAIGYLVGRADGAPPRVNGYQPRANGNIGSGGLGKPPIGGSAVRRPPNQAGGGQRR